MLVEAEEGESGRFSALPRLVSDDWPRRRRGGHFFSCLRVYALDLLLFWKAFLYPSVQHLSYSALTSAAQGEAFARFCCSPSARSLRFVTTYRCGSSVLPLREHFNRPNDRV